MLERFFVLPTTVDRIRASWIADQIEQYVEWLAEHEYRPRSILRRVPLIVRFGEFARSHGASHFEELPSHVDAFAKDQIRKRLRPCSKQLARRRLHADITHPIQQLFRVALPDYSRDVHAGTVSQPFGSQAPQFFDYLQEQRGLKKATMRLYRDHLTTYEQYLRQAGIKDLTHLSTDAIEGFITWRSTQLSPTSLRGLCSALRLFFRYLYREQILDRDLSSAIEAPRAYRLSTIPRSIEWGKVREMLDSVDRRSALGKRDYAMLLLLVTYGLRAREVASLRLDDIDWRSERLQIPERKADHAATFPLSPIVGEALLDYLKSGRPRTTRREVFFRARAPRRPISHRVVSLRASYYLRKIGVEVHRPGSHTLRHSCAQHLLDADFSLKVIGDYLGHRSASSTEIYAKVAIEALREVALGDGEEIL